MAEVNETWWNTSPTTNSDQVEPEAVAVARCCSQKAAKHDCLAACGGGGLMVEAVIEKSSTHELDIAFFAW